LRFFGAESAEKRVFAGGKGVSAGATVGVNGLLAALGGPLFSGCGVVRRVWKGGAECKKRVWTRRGTLGAKGYPCSRCSRRGSV